MTTSIRDDVAMKQTTFPDARPPVGLERMLPMYIAQQCFGLSDAGIEDASYDSQPIRGSAGIDLTHESASDATRLLKFRSLPEKHYLAYRIFDEINGRLAADSAASEGSARLLPRSLLGTDGFPV